MFLKDYEDFLNFVTMVELCCVCPHCKQYSLINGSYNSPEFFCRLCGSVFKFDFIQDGVLFRD